MRCNTCRWSKKVKHPMFEGTGARVECHNLPPRPANSNPWPIVNADDFCSGYETA